MRAFLHRFILQVFIFILATSSLAIAAETPPDVVKKAARDGLKELVKNRKIDETFKYQGFETQADIDNSELGEGFQMCYINRDKFLDDSAAQDLQNLVVCIDRWKFPVVTGGKAKTLLDIVCVHGSCGGHSSLSSWLAKEMTGILAVWPASSGYHYRFIGTSPAEAALLEISKGGKAVGVVPLTTLKKSTGRNVGEFKAADLRDPKEVLDELRPQARKNMDLRSPPAEAVNAARIALENQVKNHNIEDRRMFGFESQADIDNAMLGEGFQEFGISSSAMDRLLDESISLDFQSIVTPGGIWWFPILANGRIITLISVSFTDGEWSSFKMGGGDVAMVMSALGARWPTSDGYRLRYITMLPTMEFLELSKLGKGIGVVPLSELDRTPGRTVGEVKPEDLRDPQEIMSKLRIQIKKNREWGKKKQLIRGF